MILLVPISPEVPKHHASQLWPGLVLVILLCIGFLEIHQTLEADTHFVEGLYEINAQTGGPNNALRPQAVDYLKLRPLLKIAPAPRNWDWKRILYANFIHGSKPHLFLNLIGAFAGARICAAFMPFLVSLSIFILGGSAGILASLLLSSANAGYVPHVGASAGIFALMGTYYVYNFRFRTRYFFWFPSRRGNRIALKTSWFFFLDVILLEIVLSLAQMFPSTGDSVDHLAHVFGFGSGMLLAVFLRSVQRWPQYLQTRGEFLYWKNRDDTREYHPIFTRYYLLTELLTVNPYNDQLKIKLYRHLALYADRLTDAQLAVAFGFISPTFLRPYADEAAEFIKEVLNHNRPIPREWLMYMPYDSIIRIAKAIAQSPEDQPHLLRLVKEYRRVHQVKSGDLDRKLELLMRKLGGLIPNQPNAAAAPATPPAMPNESSETPSQLSEDEVPPPSKTKTGS